MNHEYSKSYSTVCILKTRILDVFMMMQAKVDWVHCVGDG
jgi:hypothetical protein